MAATTETPSLPRKRASPFDEEALPAGKRQRVGSIVPLSPVTGYTSVKNASPNDFLPSLDEQARSELRRSIALALDLVGFDSASEEALESFTLMTESYVQSIAQDISRSAYAARRPMPNPADYDVSLARFNLTTASLKPHRKNPVQRSKLHARYFDPLDQRPPPGSALPLISPELSGQPEKTSKRYIPKNFPDFPSVHTYKYTPEDVDAVTIQGSGLVYENGTAVGDATRNVPDGPRGDAKRMREAAARETQQAEEALRGLLQAGKINALREVRDHAQKDKFSKRRYDLWENAMIHLLDKEGKIPAAAKAAGASSTERLNTIADHTMMVNADRAYHRKGVQRRDLGRK